MLEQIISGNYRLQYEQLESGSWYPTLWKKGEIVFSGWLCDERRDAQTLLVSTYYQLAGQLEPGYQAVDYRLLAQHPLNQFLIATESDGRGNIETLKQSVLENGNYTSSFPLIASPDGLIPSGNSRLAAISEVNADAIARGEDAPFPEVYVIVKEEAQENLLLLLGNAARQKSDMMLLREAQLKAQLNGGIGKGYHTRALEIFTKDFGRSKGVFYAANAVKEFIEESKADEKLKEDISAIANSQSATVAHEIINLGDPAQLKAFEKKNPDFDATKVYPDLQRDVATLKRLNDQRSVPKIAAELMALQPETREKAIARKIAGDESPLAEIAKTIQSQVLIGADGTEVKPQSIFTLLRDKGIHPNDCWNTNRETVKAMLHILGGKIDLDPFASAEEYKAIPAEKYYTPLEDAFAHPWEGIIATNFPFSIQTKCFKEMCQNIQLDKVKQACFITEAALLFSKEGQNALKLIPFAYCLVQRSKSNTFGFEPSKYLLDNFPDIGTDNNRAYNVIWYYGDNVDLFAEVASKFGEIGYSSKLTQERVNNAYALRWVAEAEKNGYTASMLGHAIALEYVEKDWFVFIDNVEQEPNFDTVIEARNYAIASILNSIPFEDF